MKDFIEELERLVEYQEGECLAAYRRGSCELECFHSGYIDALRFVIKKLEKMNRETL